MGELAKWRKQKWVRVGTDGKIKGSGLLSTGRAMSNNEGK